MRRLWMLLVALALLGAVSVAWAISQPMQNGQNPMGAIFLHATYGGL